MDRAELEKLVLQSVSNTENNIPLSELFKVFQSKNIKSFKKKLSKLDNIYNKNK